jgi:hypothetical protein
MQALSNIFGDRIISSSIWSASSPIIILVIFFFWASLKDKVYNSNPQTEELKENICKEIVNIPAEQLESINQSLFCQCKECLCVGDSIFNTSHYL